MYDLFMGIAVVSLLVWRKVAIECNQHLPKSHTVYVNRNTN